VTFLASQPREQRQQLQVLQQTPGDPDGFKPGFFQGSGTALAVGLGRVGTVANQLAGEAEFQVGALFSRPLDSLFDTDFTGFLDEKLRQGPAYLTAQMTPDPMTTGSLGRILYSLVGIGVPAGVGAYLGGPAGAAALGGGFTTAGTFTDLTQQGVDPNTAAGAAVIEGSLVGVGVGLPAAIGGRVALNTLLYGPGINVAQDLIAGQGTAAWLEARGYDELADHYATIDAEMIAADIVLGAAFGWAGARANRVPRGTVTSDAVDAAQTALDQRHVALDTAPGIPANVAAAQAHLRTLTDATEALLDGRPVEVEAPAGTFVPKPANPARSDAVLVQAFRESGLPELMDEVAGLEAELAKRGRIVAEEPLPDLGAAMDRLEGGPAPATTPGAIRAFHGTGAKFDSFSADFHGTGHGAADWGEGFYFTDSRDAASGYATGPDGRVLEVELDIKNPATNDVLDSPAVRDALEDDMGFATVEDALAEMGYDGIVYTHKDGEREIVVFDPAKIRILEPRRGARLGRVTDVKIGEEYAAARWGVMEAEDVAPTLTVAENQLRDRTRMASQLQVDEMAAKLDPRLLLADVPTMDHGAPTLSADGKVVAGNGRALAVRKAYSGERGRAYREALLEAAGRYGLNQAEIEGMRAPVLVRVLQQAVDVERAAILSNEGGAMRMSGLEQARVDAGRLPSLAAVELPESGDFTAASMRDYVRGWLGQFPAGQRAALVDAGGQLSQEGMTRLRNAVLFRAYGDSAVLQRLVESTDPGARNVAQALVKAAPKVAEVKDAIARGELHPLDLSDAIVRTADLAEQIRDQGLTVDQWIAQLDLFNPGETPATLALLKFVDANKRSAKAIAEMLTGYYDGVIAAGNPGQGDMLGGGAPDQVTLLDAAIKKAAPAKHDAVVQDTLFRPASAEQDYRAQLAAMDMPADVRAGITAVYDKATLVKPKFDRLVHDVADELGATFEPLLPTKLKGIQRAAEKVVAKYRGDYGKLWDVVRATIVVDAVDQVPAAIAALKARAKVVEVENTLDPKGPPKVAEGYRDANVILEIDGLRAEVQINIPYMLAAKEGQGHVLYEQQRTLAERYMAENRDPTPAEFAEIQRLREAQLEVYSSAWEAATAARNPDSSVALAVFQNSAMFQRRGGSTSQARHSPSGDSVRGTPASTANSVPAGNRSGSRIASSSGASVAQDATIAQGATVAAEAPRLAVATEDGTAPAREAMLRAEVAEQRAQSDAAGFEAAVNCFLRSGQ
jgi:hypothetical protein